MGMMVQMNSIDVPSVSIITPSFNHAAYIRQTIESVLSQDYPCIEHIVVDGGSTDGTAEILREYGDRYPDRFRWVSEPDRGQSHAFNKGLAMARGEFIGWQNSDDYYYPNVFAEPIRYLIDHPDVAAVFSERHMFDEATNTTIKQFSGAPFSYFQLLEDDYLPNQAAFWRRDVLMALGGLSEDLHYAMDYDLWLRLGLRHTIVYLPGVRAAWRSLPNVKTVSGLARALNERVAILERTISDPSLPPPLAAHGRFAIQRHLFSALIESLVFGQDDQAGLLLHKSLSYDPTLSQWKTLFSKLLLQQSMIQFWLGRDCNDYARTVPMRLLSLLHHADLGRSRLARQTAVVAHLALAWQQPSLRRRIPYLVGIASAGPTRVLPLAYRMSVAYAFQGKRMFALQLAVARVRTLRSQVARHRRAPKARVSR